MRTFRQELIRRMKGMRGHWALMVATEPGRRDLHRAPALGRLAEDLYPEDRVWGWDEETRSTYDPEIGIFVN